MGEAMTADAIRTNLALLESELEFVLTDAGAHKEIQAQSMFFWNRVPSQSPLAHAS